MENDIKQIMKKMWHEVDCPAHSNQMRPESECNCIFSHIEEELTHAYHLGIQTSLEVVKEKGHQQDDDTIWCNMDEVSSALSQLINPNNK